MKVVGFCRQEVTRLVGTLSGSTLTAFLETMIEAKEKQAAVDSAVYSAEQRLPEALEMAQRLVKSFELDDVEKNQLNLLFAHETEWTKLE
jgi:hypothetical protein